MRHMRFCAVWAHSHRLLIPDFAVLDGTSNIEDHVSQLYFHQALKVGRPSGSQRLLNPQVAFRVNLDLLLD
jgi:hypothetical protein